MDIKDLMAKELLVNKMNKTIVVPIFNNEYKVIVCWGSPQHISTVIKSWKHKRDDVEEQLKNRRGVCFYAKDCHPIIALPKRPQTAEEIGTLTHEAVHAITNIFIKLDEDNYDEVFAHSVGAVVRHVLQTPPKGKQ